MSLIEKLKRIQALTGKNQTQLADFFGVSFPTMNSWLNQKSIPRKKAQEKIHLIYQEYTGVRVLDETEVEQKREEIQQMRKEISKPLQAIVSRKDLYDTFVLELTYHTNSIEGSTLNEPEVKAIIFDNATIPDKTVIEHQEAKNHQAALGYLFRLLSEGKKEIEQEHIKALHAILMNGIWPDAGRYRNHPVRIVGSKVVTANHVKIPLLMASLVRVLNKKTKDTVAHLATTHAQFEQIHPFSDGNGRVGRLLMDFIALRDGFPPVLVKREKKMAYYKYLERAQTENTTVFLELFITDGILESYKLIK